MTRIVYTAIFGDYDELKEPTVISKNVRYVCFSDRPISSTTWEVKVIKTKRESARAARHVKIYYDAYFHSLKESDQLMWIDANQQINCDLNELFDNAKSDFQLLSHPDRECIYKEAKACIDLKKDNQVIINNQISHYQNMGYPSNNGLVATGLMIRRPTSAVRMFCHLWYSQIEKYSFRDQLSFNYVHYRYPLIKYDTIPFETLKQKFKKCRHKKR